MDSDIGNTQLSPPQSPQLPPRPGPNRPLWALVIGLGLLLGLAGFAAWRLDLFLKRVETQNAQLSRKAAQAEQKADAALLAASQAAASARRAAAQRNQAEDAKAQSEEAAQLARNQAQAAQAKASKAQQTAQQYRKERELELARLQQALSQIADTRRTAMGVIMTLDSNSIRFAFDKAVIKPKYREVLSRIAGILSMLKGYRIFVYGYTDDIGTQAYNLKLSERRAQAVRDYLVKAGLNPKIMSTKGFGKEDPRVPGNSPQARAANRRVEIGIVDSTLGYPMPVGPKN